MNNRVRILRLFNGDFTLVLHKQAIIKKGRIAYFNNTDKYVGDILTRLVRSGRLIRIKRGYYMLGKAKKAEPLLVNPNQLKLL